MVTLTLSPLYVWQDGEPVEFDTEADESGRIRATVVTGPNGGPVQGRPRQPFGGGGGSFGGGGGGGSYGGGGGGFGQREDDDDDMWTPKN